MEFTGKSAIITGGARGIGKQIALTLAGSGADIVLVDVLPPAELVASAKDIQATGVRCLALQADVSNFDQMTDVANKTVEAFGNIHILVNNAGITRDNLAMRMSDQEWDQVITVNLRGTFICTKAVIRQMMKQRAGKIVNIASIVGVMGNAGQANYSASKAGIIGFTKSIAKEVAERNINVNAIAPGFIATAMTDKLKDDVKAQMLAQIPLRRFGSVQDVARAVRFLCSEDSSYITGHVVHITGGMGM
ncbi:MAG TPA: 3-oxoacyl-[acyl-carrier-protein] reductase [Planctomycetota bacterium]|nr:3-oxoacyl-[acyl-carrier-protein] reductase [Planctomycetota bacterium]